jgi:hypothetical protein
MQYASVMGLIEPYVAVSFQVFVVVICHLVGLIILTVTAGVIKTVLQRRRVSKLLSTSRSDWGLWQHLATAAFLLCLARWC